MKNIKLIIIISSVAVGIIAVAYLFGIHKRDIAHFKNMVVLILLRQTPESVKDIFRDKAFVELVKEISDDRQFPTTINFNGPFLMPKKLFVPTEMYGKMRYCFKPNVKFRDVVVWSGLNYVFLKAPLTPELEKKIHKCRVELSAYSETDENGFKKTGSSRMADYDKTIFFLGDSFTEGICVPPENTFAVLFGKDLKQEGVRARVFNLGTEGYGALEMCWMLEKYAPLLKPRLVVVNLFPNDVGKDYIAVVKGESVPEENYQEMFFYLKQMFTYCEKFNIKIVISVIPCAQQLTYLKNFSVFQDRVRVWAQKHGLSVIDARNYFQKIGEEKIYAKEHAHFSAEGHRHYADFLYKMIGTDTNRKWKNAKS